MTARETVAGVGRFVVCVCAIAWATTGRTADTIVFGPQTYVRGSGKPVEVKKTFRVDRPAATYTLRVVNHGVTSAEISLNGRTIFDADDFILRKGRRDRDGRARDDDHDNDKRDNDKRDGDRKDHDKNDDDDEVAVASLTKAVTLRAGTNEVVLELMSKPGTSLTLDIFTTGATTDTTPPTISAMATPPPNANGWNNTDVTVTFACADSGSGIATCPSPVVVSTEGGAHVVSGTATDKAGHSATTSVTLKIDKTPPVVAATPSPASNANGWNNGPVTVTFSAVDALSGIAPSSVTAPRTFSTDGANQSAAGQAADLAGNVGVATRLVSIDRTAPTLTVAVTPPPNADGWRNGPVTAHYTCGDAGSGVVSCPPDQTVATEGLNQTVTRTVTDRAGNTASVTSAPFNIDLAPPAVTATLSPSPNANGWNNGPVTVHFVCADTGSGVAVCPPDRTLTTEGEGQPISGTARDRAGNESAAFARVSIDTTPPAFSWVSPRGGTTLLASPITASGTVTDALSGVANATCNGSTATLSGNVISCGVTLAPGQNSISAVVTDVAGNSRTTTLPLMYTRGPTVTIVSPANQSYFNITPTTVTGTVDDATATVTVNSIQAPVVNGTFSIPLPLAEGPNVVTATATVAGAVSTASISVTLDTTQPHVMITSPPDHFVTTEASISVAGAVNDIVVGTVNDQQAQVTVNGVPAHVSNRTFLVADVPLSIGPNVIQAVGRDRVGNAATTEITVTRQTPSRPQIRLLSGSNQAGTIGSAVPSPLVVAVSDAAGNPVPSRPVIFKVTQNDGLLVSTGLPAPTVIATTDAQGHAEARWILGHRAGAGGNAAQAYAVGFDGTALFTATGTQGLAGLIVVDSGNDQVGAISQPLARPFIAVVVDEGNNRLGGVPVTFAVTQGGGDFDGQPSTTVTTDSDGRAAATLTLGPQDGNAVNVVEADFPLDFGLPATFSASGRVPGDPANTTISGIVLDNSNTPIPGVTIRAVLTSALRSNLGTVQSAAAIQTNAQGLFVVPQAPVGLVKLLVDGTTAQLAGTYPSLEYDMVTVSGRDNTVGQPIYLLPLTTANQLCVTATTGGGTLTIPEAPGFSLAFGPGQVTFPGGSKTGCIGVTVVHGDKVPMAPAFGQQPRFIVTIQPPGAIFSPPAPLTMPNVDGLKPREVTEMYSFDHDIGSFVAIGTGTVSNDGQLIQSDPGVGVLKAGWHSDGPPKREGSVSSLRVSITSANPLNVDKGGTATATASGRPSPGLYTWSIADPTIAALLGTSSGSDLRTVLVKGIAIGTTALSVRYRRGNSSVVDTVTVKVREVARVRITPPGPMSLSVDALGTLTASGTPTPGTYTWSSGDATVAEIQGPSDAATVTVKGKAIGRTVVRVHYEAQSGATADGTVNVSVSNLGGPPLPDFILGQDATIVYAVTAGTTFDSMRLEIRNLRGELVFKKTGLPASPGTHSTAWEGIKWNQAPNAGKYANPNNGPYDVNLIGVRGSTETTSTRSSDVRLIIEAELTDVTPAGATPTSTAGLFNVKDTLKIVMKRGSVETIVSGAQNPVIEANGPPNSVSLKVNADDFNTLDDGLYTVLFKDLRDDVGNFADADGDPMNGIQPYSFTVNLR